MLICAVMTGLGLLSLIFYVREKLKQYSVKALFCKTLVSCFFIAVALFALAVNPSRFGYFILGGLFCGILGDIWLDLKYVYRADDAPYTYAGFVCFSVGHVLFLLGLFSEYGEAASPGVLIIAAAVSALLGVGTVFAGPLLKLNYGKFRGISLLYGPLLFATTFFSLVLATSWEFSVPALNRMALGGALFTLSDLVLCGTYFAADRERPVDILLNYLFYYSAQFVIAWSVLFV